MQFLGVAAKTGIADALTVGPTIHDLATRAGVVDVGLLETFLRIGLALGVGDTIWHSESLASNRHDERRSRSHKESFAQLPSAKRNESSRSAVDGEQFCVHRVRDHLQRVWPETGRCPTSVSLTLVCLIGCAGKESPAEWPTCA
ncbi:MAG: hypothetical protein M3046_06655 [Actinomycetota bacterium]|nr:hypothetical protein [Actinomycetota bacterium]